MVWMRSLHKNIQLMLKFLNAVFLVLHFTHYTLMTLLMMLSVILLSLLIVLFSILSVIRHLICGNNKNCLLNLNLIHKTLWTGTGTGLLISVMEKLSWFHPTGVITVVLLIWKWVSLFLKKNHILRCWRRLSFLNGLGLLHYFYC